jgi:hypothetical protein
MKISASEIGLSRAALTLNCLADGDTAGGARWDARIPLSLDGPLMGEGWGRG